MPPPLPEGYLDDVVLATIHCHVLRNVRMEIPDLIGKTFAEEEIKEARDNGVRKVLLSVKQTPAN